MFELLFKREVGSSPKLLLLGAHSDDIEIGSGGTILRFLERFPGAVVYWVVFSAVPERAVEAQESAKLFLSGIAESHVMVKDFRESYFPYEGGQIKGFFEELKGLVDPDLVLTHFREDLHQDHRTISSLTWNTFRNQTVLEYEIPKYDGDLGRPSVFVPLSADTCERKIRYLMRAFRSQTQRPWFTEDTFRSLLRLRGVEAHEKYAEAFHLRKLVMNRIG